MTAQLAAPAPLTDLPGLRLDLLTWPLEPTASDPAAPLIESPAPRFYARFPSYVNAYKADNQDLEGWWTSGWRSIPHKMMAKVFTPDELMRFVWGSPVQSAVGDYFQNWKASWREETEPPDIYAHVLWKVRNSMWHWGWTDDYNMFVKLYTGLRHLTFGEGFEVRLDHTLGCNERGTAVHMRKATEPARFTDPCPKQVYLDGVFGLLVYRKGIHVLTVGFSPSKHGILIHQVQLREPKGNRWLFRLPKGLLSYVVDRIRAAYDLPVYLVDGASCVASVRRAYGGRASDFDEKNVAERIRSFYDAPLDGYRRGAPVSIHPFDAGPNLFYKLISTEAP